MKFKDIPQFTAESNYQINQPLRSLFKFIKEEQDELNLQLNPDFQRGHVWTESQQVAFIEYLLRGGKSGRDIYFNNPQRKHSTKEYFDYVCVDGLQRLTACLKFLNNEIKAFGYYYNEFEDKLFNVDLIIHVNDLQTRNEVLTWYLEMNSGGTVHTEEELNRVKKLLKTDENINK